jgi:hypothetical protein
MSTRATSALHGPRGRRPSEPLLDELAGLGARGDARSGGRRDFQGAGLEHREQP